MLSIPGSCHLLASRARLSNLSHQLEAACNHWCAVAAEAERRPVDRAATDPLARLDPSAAARLAKSAAAASAAVADTEDDNNMGLATSSFAFGPAKPAASESKVSSKTVWYTGVCVHGTKAA